MKRLCDTHCHLNLEQFQDDLNAVIHRSVQAGVRKILVPGIDFASSQEAVELSERYAGVIYPAVGIHPNNSSKVGIEEINKLRMLISYNPGIRAIGEIGLDFYRTWASYEDQYYIFNEMLKLAEEFNLPICLHVRDASKEILDVLDPWYAKLAGIQHTIMNRPGVFHSFGGNEAVAQWAIERNFMLGISGPVTYNKAESLRSSISALGLDHIILETDAPYLSPQPKRGKRNEPANIQFIAEKLSEVLSMPVEDICEITSRNAQKLFEWDDA